MVDAPAGAAAVSVVEESVPAPLVSGSGNEPHGPAPYAPLANADAHDESSNPAVFHPACSVADAFQFASVTTCVLPRTSFASAPAGPTEAFVARMAITLVPA